MVVTSFLRYLEKLVAWNDIDDKSESIRLLPAVVDKTLLYVQLYFANYWRTKANKCKVVCKNETDKHVTNTQLRHTIKFENYTSKLRITPDISSVA